MFYFIEIMYNKRKTYKQDWKKKAMKKTLIRASTLMAMVVSLFVFTSCLNQQKDIQVYSFSGENDTFAVNNGVIIVTDDLEKFVGGDLSFRNTLPDVKNSAVRYYFFKDGVETTLQENSDINNNLSNGTAIQKDTGSISSEDLFYGNDLELIIKSLNFSLKGTFLTGEKFEYSIPLEVKRIY